MLSCVDSNSSHSSVKSCKIMSMKKKKSTAHHIFPTTIVLWPILYEYLSRYVKEGNEDHIFMIIRDCLYNSHFLFFASD